MGHAGGAAGLGRGGEQGEDVPGFASGGDVVGWFYLGRGAAFDRLVSSPWVLNPRRRQ